MRTYEGLFIFNDALPEDRVKESAGRINGDIEKAGGRVVETRPLGRRQFARPLSKKDSGFYVAILFAIDETKLTALSARLKLDEDILRFQIVRMEEKKKAEAARPPAAE